MFCVCQFIDACLHFLSTHLPRWIFVLTRSWPDPGADSLLQKSCLGKRETIEYIFFVFSNKGKRGHRIDIAKGTVHNVYFVKYDDTVSFMTQYLIQ